MLRLKRLEIEGFGPFAEREVVDFPTGNGVVVVYGENMRGKTTLLNAIRYAFFGRVLGRGRRERKIHGLSNRDRGARGEFGFSVTLDFDFDGVAYELHRSHGPRVPVPVSDVDYEVEVLLRRGNVVLNQQDRDRALAQIFPWDISRFFLFDGELLQEYEELIINESETGPQISQAIERILGVPLLKAGRRHLVQLADDADRQAANEASRHRDTQALGNALQEAIKVRTAQQNELNRQQEILVDLQRQKSEVAEKLGEDRRAADLMAKRQEALERADAAAEKQTKLRSEVKLLMRDGWRTLLLHPVRRLRDELAASLSDQLDATVAELRQQAIAETHCRVCDQDVASAVRVRLQQSISTPMAPAALNASARLRGLSGFQETDITGEVQQLIRQIENLTVEEQHLRDEAKDLLEALGETEQSTIRSTQASYADIVEQIGITKKGIDDQTTALQKQGERVEALRRKLQNSSLGDLSGLEARAEILRDTAALFADAVEVYKSDLRGKVEQSATTLFLSMSTEKTDYAGLSINEDYGLTIMHKDGTPEDARSAGAEHIVALALMGALQQNAPLRGPIVMDSPFGRLDEGHTSNVLSGLHVMADQVMLLVYEAEVNKESARSLLGSRLVAEYELQKINSRRTKIREVRQ